MNTKMIVVMKNGHKFTVEVPNSFEWIKKIVSGTDPKSQSNYCWDQSILFALEEIAAIHPAASEVSDSKDSA